MVLPGGGGDEGGECFFWDVTSPSVPGYLGSSPDPGCQFPASISPKNTEERSMCSL
jgi:hypothetical protein